MNDPIKNYYLLGYSDALDKNRKRKRSVAQNYKLSYINGWWDARNGKPSIH